MVLSEPYSRLFHADIGETIPKNYQLIAGKNLALPSAAVQNELTEIVSMCDHQRATVRITTVHSQEKT